MQFKVGQYNNEMVQYCPMKTKVRFVSFSSCVPAGLFNELEQKDQVQKIGYFVVYLFQLLNLTFAGKLINTKKNHNPTISSALDFAI